MLLFAVDPARQCLSQTDSAHFDLRPVTASKHRNERIVCYGFMNERAVNHDWEERWRAATLFLPVRWLLCDRLMETSCTRFNKARFNVKTYSSRSTPHCEYRERDFSLLTWNAMFCSHEYGSGISLASFKLAGVSIFQGTSSSLFVGLLVHSDLFSTVSLNFDVGASVCWNILRAAQRDALDVCAAV